jgi:isoleucyl-tRNA synthetase
LPDASLIDESLLSRMDAALEIVALGRSIRTTSNLRVRQPLARIVAAGPTDAAKAALRDRDVVDAIRDELNVKVLEVADARTDVADFTLKPNLPTLGPRLGKKLARRKPPSPPPKALLDALLDGRAGTLVVDGAPFEVEPKDVLVECRGHGAFVASADRGWMVALDTTVTPELQREGLAREILNRIQGCRKEAALDVADRIRLEIDGTDDVVAAATTHRALLLGEALGTKPSTSSPGYPEPNSMSTAEGSSFG